jgi:hypothetical protein
MHRRLWLPLALLALGSGACTLLFGDYHVRTDGGGGGGSTGTSTTGTSTTGPASTTSGTGGATTTSSATANLGGGGNVVTGSSGTTSTSGSTSTNTGSTSTSTGKAADGAPCTAGADCLSGHCFAGVSGGVCCNQACTGGSPCTESCDLSVTYQGAVVSWAGQCLPVASGMRAECAAGRYCSLSKGGCVIGDPYGTPCTTAANCASGRCRLGICDTERQPIGSPCLNHYGCVNDSCNPTTHLCQ